MREQRQLCTAETGDRGKAGAKGKGNGEGKSKGDDWRHQPFATSSCFKCGQRGGNAFECPTNTGVHLAAEADMNFCLTEDPSPLHTLKDASTDISNETCNICDIDDLLLGKPKLTGAKVFTQCTHEQCHCDRDEQETDCTRV